MRPLLRVALFASFALGACGVAGLLASCAATPYPIDSKRRGDSPWGEECLIHRPCEGVLFALPSCGRNVKTSTLPDVDNRRLGSETTASIAGRLRLEKGDDPLVQCRNYPDQGCCVHLRQRAILVGEDASTFELPGIGCFGDNSRMCCKRDRKGTDGGGDRTDAARDAGLGLPA
jgi:hypothetical protein